jgi:hypothetical protein
MSTVSITFDELATPPSWCVNVGALSVRFFTAEDAERFAAALQRRIDAPHVLPGRSAA